MQFVRAFGHDKYSQEIIDPPKGRSGHQEIPIKEIIIGAAAAVLGNFVQRGRAGHSVVEDSKDASSIFGITENSYWF